VAGHLAPVAVLETEHHLASSPREGHCSAYAVRSRLRTGPEQCESAGGAHGGTWGITSGTTSLEHHVPSVNEGCPTVLRPVPPEPPQLR
jgi:hypothetical protein